MKTIASALPAGIFPVVLVNGLGQPATQAPNSGDGLWQAVEQMPAEKVRKQRSLNGGIAPFGGLVEYMDTNASARSSFYRTVQP